MPGSGVEAPQTPPKEPESIPVESKSIQDVTHALRSEVLSKAEQHFSRFPHPEETVPVTSAKVRDRNFTQENFRSMGAPSISPVSYQKKTTPLVEFKVEESPIEKENEPRDDTKQLEREGKEIVENTRKIQRFIQPPMIQSPKMVSFPLLIKQSPRPQKRVLDLFRAIQEVKFNARQKNKDYVEAHVNLGVNVSRSDMVIRGTVKLPHGNGKVVKVMVFAEGEAADEARAAGADIVGGSELVEEIRETKQFAPVDRVICTISFMDQLKKIGIILRNMMPNQKKGTLTDNVAKAVKDSKMGFTDFKMDRIGNVHLVVGKVRFAEEALVDNTSAFMSALLLLKPKGVTKDYVRSLHLCSSNARSSVIVSARSFTEAVKRFEELQKRRIPMDNKPKMSTY